MSDLAAAATTSPRRVREPKVLPSYPVRRALSTLVTSPSLLVQILPSLLPLPPRWLQLFIYLLLAANITSFPGTWHITLFRPLLTRILRARAATAALVGSRGGGDATDPRTGRQIRHEVLPLGKDIFETKTYRSGRAWPADCDYLFHLSNSSYAKTLDYSRGALHFSHFYRFLSEGGRLFLGGSNFHFHKEIPIMAKYEVQMRLASWDDKWVYLVGTFTSPTDPTSREPAEPVPTSTPGTSSRTPRISLSRSASNLRGLLSDISKPEHEAQAAEQRRRSRTVASELASENDTAAASPSYFPAGAQGEKLDETKVYCTTVSRYCFKYGRKTIPPWFVIATSGFGTWASTRNNWDKAEEVRVRSAKGSFVKKGGATKKLQPWEGMLNAFDPRVDKERGESGEAKGEGVVASWCDRGYWSLSEWEPRRRQGLAYIEKLGGLAPQAGATAP
ncbi:hypothetical protein BCV69DRAFT_283371 [Microstroma glucosiphilum]|uniref:Uncharacterized protein n=1 Tax=Pseudomicrostroma glucosiphilum TaxID=1684307 RepID=A0A316U5H9_9BASI|nr:hypothetical protein BCV69DRAFT_283371 [Pseudomicrostroma glucosiphilum]PWN20486.1 hypothetical protein BCV69DRAFT_283371 [Pseudomicrostroma glucosiphilum]